MSPGILGVSMTFATSTADLFVASVNCFWLLVNVTTRNCALHFLETILISKRLRFKMIKPSKQIHAES